MVPGWAPGTSTTPFLRNRRALFPPRGSDSSFCVSRVHVQLQVRLRLQLLPLPLRRIATASAVIAVGAIYIICGPRVCEYQYLALSCGSPARSPNRTLGRDFVRVGHHAMGAVQLTLFARREIFDRVKVTVFSGCCLSTRVCVCLSSSVRLPVRLPVRPPPSPSRFGFSLATVVMHIYVCYASVRICRRCSKAKARTTSPTKQLVAFLSTISIPQTFPDRLLPLHCLLPV